MDNQAVNEAIEILINNFTRHPSLSQQHNVNDATLAHNKLNAIDLLQEFWTMKTANSSSSAPTELSWGGNDANIVYEFLETPEPPFVCFVTLPGGACFATFQVK